MPFEIVRNDITNMQVDAIVNPASRRARFNPGVDMAIHKKAGPKLLEARRIVGDIAIGDAEITPGFDLDAQFVIHAPSPIWIDGTKGEARLLRKTYERCLRLALENNCESIAFPLLASGNHGFPKQQALRIAIQAFSDFLMEHDMYIYLVVFGNKSVALSEKLVQNVTSYIDEHYVEAYEEAQYDAPVQEMRRRRYQELRQRELQRELLEKELSFHAITSAMPEEEEFNVPHIHAKKALKVASPTDLKTFLKQKDDGFAVTLVDLIERSGKKNSEIYKKANVDKKLFSKIINNVKYHPSKQTAVAFAIALELDLEETQDLIGRAGYTLTHSSRFDLIIEYFILTKNYNIFDINAVLFEMDEQLLGY